MKNPSDYLKLAGIAIGIFSVFGTGAGALFELNVFEISSAVTGFTGEFLAFSTALSLISFASFIISSLAFSSVGVSYFSSSFSPMFFPAPFKTTSG